MRNCKEMQYGSQEKSRNANQEMVITKEEDWNAYGNITANQI